MMFSEQFSLILDDLARRFGVAIDWSMDNVVPYMTTLFEHLIHYTLARDITILSAMAVLTIIFLMLASIGIKKRWCWDIVVLLIATSAFLCLAYIIVLCKLTPEIIACVAFPEKIILGFFKETVGG